MRIAIIDGQGGGVGRALIAELKPRLPAGHTVVALGANALATAAMLKAGADEGATGENAVVYNCARADVIAGPIGIVLANSMLGELTPAMARAVAESPAEKVLVPMEKCRAHVAGAKPQTMQQAVEQAAALILALVKGE